MTTNSVKTIVNNIAVEFIALEDARQAKRIRKERGIDVNNWSCIYIGSPVADVEDAEDFEWSYPETFKALQESGIGLDSIKAVYEEGKVMHDQSWYEGLDQLDHWDNQSKLIPESARCSCLAVGPMSAARHMLYASMHRDQEEYW